MVPSPVELQLQRSWTVFRSWRPSNPWRPAGLRPDCTWVCSVSGPPKRSGPTAGTVSDTPVGVSRRVWGAAAAVTRRPLYALRKRMGTAPATAEGGPVFIVGCGHSGTTLVLSILSAHSRLFCVPYESSLMERSAADADWFVRSFNAATRQAGKARWVEKTPRHIHHIGAIVQRFPEAKVVLLMRDGRDVVCSLRDRSGDFDAAAQRWLDDNAAAEPFLDHPAVLVLKYEDLIGGREVQLRRLMRFVGESYEPRLLEHHTSGFRFLGRYEHSKEFAARLEELGEKPASVSGSDHRRYRSWQASQPVFDGRGRWRTDLSAAERTRLEALMGDRLVAYGYADAGDS